MHITKNQLSDLLGGLGSSYVSSGGYVGSRSAITIGEILKVLADEIRENPTETYEVPPAHAHTQPIVSNEDELI